MALPISEASADTDDTLTLTITGLTSYETITDAHDSTVLPTERNEVPRREGFPTHLKARGEPMKRMLGAAMLLVSWIVLPDCGSESDLPSGPTGGARGSAFRSFFGGEEFQPVRGQRGWPVRSVGHPVPLAARGGDSTIVGRVRGPDWPDEPAAKPQGNVTELDLDP